ncbi:MAG: hypothetical protein U5P41_12375 [Gammaproteobacteria bacterium]|nr:hypothetical protein [Gammaproteobacteria bacterium]
MTGSQRSQCSRRLGRQAGQSMVEFTVVVVFFCLAVTSDPAQNAMANLMDVLDQALPALFLHRVAVGLSGHHGY